MTLRTQVSLVSRDAATVREELSALERADKDLYKRVKTYFDYQLHELEPALETAAEKTEEGQTTAAWVELEVARGLVKSLAIECLGLRQAVHWGKEDSAVVVCAIADKLLAGLSGAANLNWHSFTIVAESAFTGEFAYIIRLAFPQAGIWDLPVAAHEFGHYAATEFRASVRNGAKGAYDHPFKAILDREWSKKRFARWHELHEHFADIFAVHVLGPAFPLTCLLLRFEPRKPLAPRGWHPSAAARAYVMLKALRALNDETPFAPYSAIVKKLEELWTAAMLAADPSKALGQPAGAKLDETFDLIYPLVRDHLAPIRYSTFSQAQQLMGELGTVDHDLHTVPDDLSIADVINAAWMCRMSRGIDQQDYADDVGRRALALCRAFVDG